MEDVGRGRRARAPPRPRPRGARPRAGGPGRWLALAAGLAGLAGLAALAGAGAGAAQAQGGARADGLVELTDGNFDELTRKGTWILKMYAPWCVHCKKLEPVWDELAASLKASGVKVGQVDGTAQKGLLRRFGTSGFPTIYHLHGGETRVYTGSIGAEVLRDWATRSFRMTEAVPWYKSPVSVFGRTYGLVWRLPSQIEGLYRELHDRRGVSDFTIALLCLALPLLAGALAVLMMDIVFVQIFKGPAPAAPPAHAHND